MRPMFSSSGKPMLGIRIMRPRFRMAEMRYANDENSRSSPKNSWSSKSSMVESGGMR